MTPEQTALLDRTAKAMGFPFVSPGFDDMPVRLYSNTDPDLPSANYKPLSLVWSLDSAAACLPPGWEWNRSLLRSGRIEWYAGPRAEWGLSSVCVADTGDEVADRLTLAALAWEAA